MTEHAIFVWDGPPLNYIDVCLESLRLYNKTCIIHFHYSSESVIPAFKRHNINFIKINPNEFSGRRLFYKVDSTRKLCNNLKDSDKVLVFDNDILFQNDPFLMFSQKPNNDFYYTYCIMSTPDSLREEHLWKTMTYRINGGVRGLIVNDSSKQAMELWVSNLLQPTWDKWIDFAPRREHEPNVLDWWGDQDFLNCLDQHPPPFNLKKVDAGYRFNYYTSTWGHFNDNLNMGNKIGNKDYVVIHFKSNFREVFNLNNSKIYNIENILSGKDLTTESSRNTIYGKFMSRGEARFNVV